MSTLDFSNLRIYVDESTHKLYEELTSRAQSDAEDKPFSKMPDLFIFSSCVGLKNNMFKKLDKRKDKMVIILRIFIFSGKNEEFCRESYEDDK